MHVVVAMHHHARDVDDALAPAVVVVEDVDPPQETSNTVAVSVQVKPPCASASLNSARLYGTTNIVRAPPAS